MSGIIVAMWSGPRNLSTAMMRAFENRADTMVIDEPFYAHFLDETGIDHPMRDEILSAHPPALSRALEQVQQRPDQGIVYQKHITTHMLNHIPLEFMAQQRHAFLIRDPRRVVASYRAKRHSVTAEDLGYHRQFALFETARSLLGKVPPVIDSDRFLEDPRSGLKALCNALEIDFDDAMLKWPAGSRDSDGVWARHWYHAVEASTGFGPAPDSEPVKLPPELDAVAAQCMEPWHYMRKYTLQGVSTQ